jgi:uncharacterized Tic20 family protein
MPWPHIVALALVLPSVVVLTLVVWKVLRCESPLVARHAANLVTPFVQIPLVVALFVAGTGAGAAVLILLLQAMSGATESHMAGMVRWRQHRGRGPDPGVE